VSEAEVNIPGDIEVIEMGHFRHSDSVNLKNVHRFRGFAFLHQCKLLQWIDMESDGEYQAAPVRWPE
jgi:hypothetical protein